LTRGGTVMPEVRGGGVGTKQPAIGTLRGKLKETFVFHREKGIGRPYTKKGQQTAAGKKIRAEKGTHVTPGGDPVKQEENHLVTKHAGPPLTPSKREKRNAPASPSRENA